MGETTEAKLEPNTFEPVGFVKLIGLTLITTTAEEVVAELTVGPMHYQPMGIVHGGLYCAMVETVCSIGGHLAAIQRGRTVVGVDNQTSFLKATRTGVLRATAKPLTVGRRTQLWNTEIHDDSGALVATGRVRLICIEPEVRLAGEAARRPDGDSKTPD
jgi:1,4-dihydroxy-2-naphthoyl-CoA hydrolase